ncbi:hypothetical protein AX774_g2393 [Zancudomyces culisetae]|uniref:Uncharacterized protein n=1 Tax=Zancudomyces culisetae TaxID=1213189 RepID=A0A1R1PT12_ZANCU|nr:hypothetical protein AX774_g2393 [Zancudomyces culisetae]|eukprot:OMH84091.1 hypothetical protein AX774_g2393 [Zancudomyces culisetae]
MNDDDILEDYCIENNWEYISYHSHFPSENGDSGENDNNDDEYTTPSTSLPSFSTEPLLTNIDINTNTSTNTNNTSLPSCTCKLTLSKKTTKIVTDDVCIEFCTHTANQIISSLINTDIWVSTLDDSEKSSLSMSGLLIDDKFDVCQDNSSNTDNQKSKPKPKPKPQPQPQPQPQSVNVNENENENKNKIDPSNDKDVDSDGDSDSDKDQDTEWSEFMTFQDSDDLANLTNFIKQSRGTLYFTHY